MARYTFRKCCMPGCPHGHLYEEGTCRPFLSVSICSIRAGQYLLEQTLDLDQEATERLIIQMRAARLPENLPGDVHTMEEMLSLYLFLPLLKMANRVTVLDIGDVSSDPTALIIDISSRPSIQA